MKTEIECNHEFEIIDDYDDKRKIIDWWCSCHINPPCSFCTTEVRKCIKCREIEIENF